MNVFSNITRIAGKGIDILAYIASCEIKNLEQEEYEASECGSVTTTSTSSFSSRSNNSSARRKHAGPRGKRGRPRKLDIETASLVSALHDDESIGILVENGKEKYVCMHKGCYTVTDTKAQMERHRMRHSEEAFSCCYCGKKFSRDDNRKTHEKWHKNPKSRVNSHWKTLNE